MAQETTTVTRMTNGVDVDALMETIEAIKANPEIAQFKFNQTNQWQGSAGLNRSTIANFYGACEQHEHPGPFVLDADEPPLLLGTDKGANPVEYLLHAVTACVTTSIIYHAAARGIKIESLESRTEGDLDLRGFLGLDESVPNGYQNIRLSFKIKADAPDDQLAEIVNLGPTFSPVYDTLRRAVNVEVGMDQ